MHTRYIFVPYHWGNFQCVKRMIGPVSYTHLDVYKRQQYTLADHLNFAIERMDKGMIFSTPISNELRDLYPVEVKIAKYTLGLMKKRRNIDLPEEEMYAIAMNIINSEENITVSGNCLLYTSRCV